MRVVLVHGWNGPGEGHWLYWLESELTKRGVDVVFPTLPNANLPNRGEWIESLKKAVGEEKELILIGYSLGCVAILRFLEQSDLVAKKVVLVSGFTSDLGISEISDFFKTDFNWPSVLPKSQNFVVINSDNDPYVPLAEGEKLANALGVGLVVEKNAGHITASSGFGPYPRLLGLIF